MEDLNKAKHVFQSKNKFRLKNRFLPLTGRLDWPSFFTIVRSVKPKQKTVQELTQEALLKVYAASGVLVDKLGNIRYVYGHTGLFLEPAQGYSGFNNVLKMARSKLRRDLHKTLHQAVTRQTAASSALIPIKGDRETVSIIIRVIPLLRKSSTAQDEDFYLIIFEQKPNHQVAADDLSALSKEVADRPQLTQITAEIETAAAKLVDLRKELDNTHLELELSRNQLQAVKLNTVRAETELQTLTEKITISQEELQTLSDELSHASSIEPVAAEPDQDKPNSQPLPRGEGLDTIKHELLMASQALKEKNDILEKMNASFGNDPELINIDTQQHELNFKDAGEFMMAANHGYRHDNEIKLVHIPEGVDVIKRSMFYKCTQLETVIFPSTLKTIEDFAFYGCEKLNNLNLNNCTVLEVIGTSAFEGCLSITDLAIPDSLIEIEEAAFLGCRALERLQFQVNCQLEILGSHVFKDCQKLEKIILPDQIKHIGISCFYNCRSLSEIHLPKELETLGEYAFFGCDALTEIKLTNKKILKQPGFSVGFPDGVKLW